MLNDDGLTPGVKVNQRNIKFFGNFFHNARVLAMLVNKFSIVIELSSHHWGEQEWPGAFLTDLSNILDEVLSVICLWSGIARSVGLLGIVVSKLNEHPIAGL